MSDPKLRALLGELHARLRQGASLDSDARKHLTTALHDIEQALARGAPASASSRDFVGALAVQFEADHPAVAGVVRQLIDTLGAAGI